MITHLDYRDRRHTVDNTWFPPEGCIEVRLHHLHCGEEGTSVHTVSEGVFTAMQLMEPALPVPTAKWQTSHSPKLTEFMYRLCEQQLGDKMNIKRKSP